MVKVIEVNPGSVLAGPGLRQQQREPACREVALNAAHPGREPV